MRSLFLTFGVLLFASVGAGEDARANPLIVCDALAADPTALRACLQRERDASDRIMSEALGGARAVAQEVVEKSGGDIAVLAVEASQQAWEAYRDTACEARSAFVDSGAGDAVQLACAIELTRTRTEELLGLASLGSG